MKNCIKLLLLYFILFCGKGCKLSEKDPHLIILGDMKESYLIVDTQGGAFIDFRLSETSVNPFSWKMKQEDMPDNNRNGAVFQGHFLCLGRWGSPTEGEIKAGVPHNGQSGNQKWKVVTLQKDSLVIMRSDAPLDGIAVERRICFDKYSSLFFVTEQIHNTLSVGRLFNVVQHATLGTPFLSSSTIIDSNAGKGFMQHLSYPNPHDYEYSWPKGSPDTLGNEIDLTKSNVSESYVSTHLLEEEWGWATASSPDCSILVGYVWKKTEYPWLNIWHEMREGSPWAKGIEFGTTGIGRSYQELLETDTRFHGVNSFFFLDAMERIEKSFICFQIQIPGNYQGVKEIKIKNSQLRIVEKRSESPKEIIVTSSLIGRFAK